MKPRCPTCNRPMPHTVSIPQKRAKPRKGPMRDAKYLAWCRQQLCVAPGDYFEDHSVDVDPAHTQNNGMRSKGPDSSCVPLCREHHEEYDAGRKAFEKKYGLDIKALAAEHYARYLKEKES